MMKMEKDIQLPKNSMPQQKTSKISEPLVKFHAPKKNIPAPRYSKKQNPKDTPTCRKKIATKKAYAENKTTQDADKGNETEFCDEKNKETDPYQQIKGNELFMTDLFYKNQPHLDHCYTTIHGKNCTVDAASLDSEGDTGDQNNVQMFTKKNYPILEIVAKCENGYMVASEEILGINGKPKDPESDDDYEPSKLSLIMYNILFPN